MTAAPPEGRLGEIALALQEGEDPFLHRVLRDQPVDEHGLALPDTVRAIGRPILERRVPPRVEEQDRTGRREAQARVACLSEVSLPHHAATATVRDFWGWLRFSPASRAS